MEIIESEQKNVFKKSIRTGIWVGVIKDGEKWHLRGKSVFYLKFYLSIVWMLHKGENRFFNSP